MVKIIAVTNRKGGQGKSTMSTHIAAGMATLGYRVGIVDTDSQGHAGVMLGMPEENGLFNALIEKRALADVIREVPTERYSTSDHPSTGNLYLLPSGDKTYKIPRELSEEEGFLFLERMEEFADEYALDTIIIDTNPTMTLFDGSIYTATDGYIFVTECEKLAFDGIEKSLDQMKKAGAVRAKYLKRETKILGIIPNKLRAGTFIHRKNVADLGNAFPGLVWSPVTLRTIWTEASNVPELVYTYAPSGQEAADAWAVTNKTVEALRSWQTTETK